VLSSYFAGFTVGALRCGSIIERVGYVSAAPGAALQHPDAASHVARAGLARPI